MKFGIPITLSALLAFAAPVHAMEFKVEGTTIYGTGIIVAGDAARFVRFLEEKHVPSSFDEDVTLRLSGTAGDAREGMLLGRALRKLQIPAVVSDGTVCSFSCALAFLGGTQAYATGIGTGRVLEFGGKLSFRGILARRAAGADEGAPDDGEHLPIDALIAYAKEIRAVDVASLVEEASVSPTLPRYVNTPRSVVALRITLLGYPVVVPMDGYVRACRKLVADNIPSLDDASARVRPRGDAIPSVTALRRAIMASRDDGPALAKAIAGLNDQDAFNLVVGWDFYLDGRKPILDARTMELERGAGLYYDNCVTVRSKSQLAVILVDGSSHSLAFRNYSGDRAYLALHDDGEELW